jgi:endonuclease/exonuclease/phosphatase family metal-dependent hydrolase
MNKVAIVSIFMLIILTAGCTNAPPSMPTHAPNSITIASWNIENFGQAKATDPIRMQKIAKIIRNFDVIVVQEVSNVHEFDCPSEKCMLMTHALRWYLPDYSVRMSDQIGDERYLILYDNNVTVNATFTLNTSMMRTPYMFRILVGGTEFNLVTTHTSPSKNTAELAELGTAFGDVAGSNASNPILLGDLNADCDYLTDGTPLELRDSRFYWIIPNGADTTVGKTRCAYDRIIVNAASKERFTGLWGVYTANVTDDLSDHYPVWAEFRTG